MQRGGSVLATVIKNIFKANVVVMKCKMLMEYLLSDHHHHHHHVMMCAMFGEKEQWGVIKNAQMSRGVSFGQHSYGKFHREQ